MGWEPGTYQISGEKYRRGAVRAKTSTAVEAVRPVRPSRLLRTQALAGILAVALSSLAAVTILATQGDAQEASASASPDEAKNVILFLGDGMGPVHREAGQLATVGANDRLVMDTLPISGMVGTGPADPEEFTPDSAAAATAYATGVKTFNDAVGVDPEGNQIETILERAKAAGKSTGLVTTSQVTDASAAAFAAHVEDRDEQSEIGRQYLEESRPDVILGGGEDYWYPEGVEGAYPDNPDEEEPEVSQSDRGNLVEQAQGLGYEYVTNAAELDAAGGPKILGLFANQEMFQQYPEGDGDEYDPVVPLEEMTGKALDVLSQNPNGFFLIVEEEATDEFASQNNSDFTIKGVQELDKAVAAGKEYAQSAGDTLVIATADHEAGGMAVEVPDDPEEPDEDGAEIQENLSGEDGPFDIANSDLQFKVDWTTTAHTGVKVPLTAYGPGADLFTGTYENAEVHDYLAQAMDLPASASASASASAVPDTGGVGPGGLLLVGVLGIAGSLFIVQRTLRHRS